MLERRKPLQAKSLLKQRKPLAKVRETARREEGRIQHQRMNPRRVKPNAEEQRFFDSLPNECQGCGAIGEVIHHILANVPEKGRRRDHKLVVKLCAGCHTNRDISVHRLGSETAYEAATGVDLVARALENLQAWEASNA